MTRGQRRMIRVVNRIKCAAVEQIAARVSRVPRVAGITAQAMASVDVATGQTLFARAPHCRLAPASTVKLATALLLLQARELALDQTVVIEESDCIRGSTMGLEPGDVVSYRGLLYGLLLASGNDAAQAIARVVGSDLRGIARNEPPVERFVRALNQLGSDIGLRRTRFLNPSGLPRAGQRTTASDLAMLGIEAFTHPLIRHVAGRQRASITVAGRRARVIRLASTVEMRNEPAVLAAKTGTCVLSGANLVFLSRRGDRTAVTALLGSEVQVKRRIVGGTDRRYDDARKVMARLQQET